MDTSYERQLIAAAIIRMFESLESEGLDPGYCNYCVFSLTGDLLLAELGPGNFDSVVDEIKANRINKK